MSEEQKIVLNINIVFKNVYFLKYIANQMVFKIFDFLQFVTLQLTTRNLPGLIQEPQNEDKFCYW